MRRQSRHRHEAVKAWGQAPGNAPPMVAQHDSCRSRSPFFHDRLALCLWPVLAALGATALAGPRPAVIWECGQNVPTAAYWRAHGAALETLLPFDGVMLKIEHPITVGGTMRIDWRRNVGWKVFMRERVTEQMVRPFVEDMRAANLQKLTHNLVGVCPYPYPHIMDWFDDAWWATICEDIRIVARAARDAGCVGLVFDPEQYGPRTRLWNWRSLVDSTDHKAPYAAYAASVRARGRAFGQALSAGFPDCTILFFHGFSLLPLRAREWIEMGRGRDLHDSDYALYAPWLDGMLEGTSAGTVFVDGYETSYSYDDAESFAQGRWNILREPLTMTQVPDLFRSKTRAAFGLWVDNTFDDYKWHAAIPDMNRFSPGRLQRAIHLALRHGDGYVWLWNERGNWYLDGPDAAPQAPATQQPRARGLDGRYRVAVAQARHWPGTDTTLPPRPRFVDERTLGYIHGRPLEQLRQRCRDVQELPEADWGFRPDPEDRGAAARWYEPGGAADAWKPIRIAEFWENQGYGNLDGIAWYRRAIDFPDLPEGARLYLAFGAVDESLALWIDGDYVAAYDRGGIGWDQPFALEVTGHLRGGQGHTLVFRTRDIGRMGGIWKGITLIAE